ncbi:hypothetical protein ASF33_05220 [Methylobacterium sp. Leaf92]|jgi:hypothetical protein|nr:hypothetical protein ASF33_05220 [Methylobacterium sp. Leaf92]
MAQSKNLVHSKVKEVDNGYELALEVDDGQVINLVVSEEKMSLFIKGFEDIWFSDDSFNEEPSTLRPS